MPALAQPAVAAGWISARDQPILDLDGIRLRPFVDADIPDLVVAYSDPAIQRWHARTMTAFEAETWIAEKNAEWTTGTGASWAITEDGRCAGRMSLSFNLRDGVAGAAYWVLPAARGRGLAPRALTCVAAWCFEVGLHRVELEHSTRNETSCRVAERAGFLGEGIARQSALHADGWHDMHIHARIAGDVSWTAADGRDR